MGDNCCTKCGVQIFDKGPLCKNCLNFWADGIQAFKDGGIYEERIARSQSPLKDSGERETFPTGAIREPNLDRGRYDLISPIALKALAIHYERGASKYSARNWEKGLALSRHLNSAMRHLQNFLEGDRSEDHLSACAWNCFCIVHDREMISRGQLPPELDDLPQYLVNEDQKLNEDERINRIHNPIPKKEEPF